jgi:hypothetical protein
VIVLDTNVISEAIKPSPNAHVMAWLRGQLLANMATTAVSLAEINYGLCRLPRGRRRDDLEARLRTLLARGFGDRILAFDAPAAGVYGEIVTARQSVGRPIDAFDAMIAAIAWGDRPDPQRRRLRRLRRTRPRSLEEFSKVANSSSTISGGYSERSGMANLTSPSVAVRFLADANLSPRVAE